MNPHQPFQARVNPLDHRHLRIRHPTGSRPDTQIKYLKPPLPAHPLRPAERHGGVLARAEAAAGDGDVGLLADGGAELLEERGEGLDLGEGVGVEEGVDLLRVELGPLGYVARGEGLPPLVVADLDYVLEDDGGLGDVGEAVLAVAPCFLVLWVDW